jgi:hypothetical protein
MPAGVGVKMNDFAEMLQFARCQMRHLLLSFQELSKEFMRFGAVYRQVTRCRGKILLAFLETRPQGTTEYQHRQGMSVRHALA